MSVEVTRSVKPLYVYTIFLFDSKIIFEADFAANKAVSKNRFLSF